MSDVPPPPPAAEEPTYEAAPPPQSYENFNNNVDGDEELSDTRLFVKPFPPDVTEAEMREIFEPFGALKEIKILNGFAFVEFEEADSASQAVQNVAGKMFADYPLEVVFSKKLKPRYRVIIRNLPEGCA